MNTTVTAEGMTVEAKANSVFLQIVAEGTTFSDTEAQTIAEIEMESAKALFPTKVGSAVATDEVTALVGTETLEALKWATAYSNDPDSATRFTDFTDVSAKANSTVEAENDYTLIKKFQVRLNPTTGVESANNLTVQNVAIGIVGDATETKTFNDAVRVLVNVGGKTTVFDYQGKVIEGTGTVGANSAVLADTVTTTATDVTVYVYFDGDTASVKTNNLHECAGYVVSLDFTVTPVA